MKRHTPPSWIPAICGALFISGMIVPLTAQQIPSQSDPVVITSIGPENGRLVIRWDGAVPPYKLQSRASFADAWRDVTYHIYAKEYRTDLLATQAYWRVRTIPDSVAPEVPAALAGVPTTQGDNTPACDSVTLAWDPLPCPDTRWCSDNAGGTGLRGYRIYRDGTLVSEVTSTSFVDGGLAESTTYAYRISSIDWAGNESAQTAVVNATTPACVIIAGDKTVNLAWDPNPEPDVQGYILYYGEETGNYTDALDIGDFTTGSVPGLTTGNTYYFVVTAYNAYGESGPSEEIFYTVP